MILPFTDEDEAEHKAVVTKCVSEFFDTSSFAESFMARKINDQEEFQKKSMMKTWRQQRICP